MSEDRAVKSTVASGEPWVTVCPMKLSSYLAAKGETASEFARRAKPPLSKSAVSRLLSGDRKPGAALMEQIKRMTRGKVDAPDWALTRAKTVTREDNPAIVAPPS